MTSESKRALNERILREINPSLLQQYKEGQLPRHVEAAIADTLGRDFGLTAQTSLAKAQAAFNKELNLSLGQNINNVAELRQVLDLYAGPGNAANRGKIGNAFYQSKLAQGERVQEFGYSRELWTGKPISNYSLFLTY